MDFLELTKKRYSVRSYTSQEVEKEKLDYPPILTILFLKKNLIQDWTE